MKKIVKLILFFIILTFISCSSIPWGKTPGELSKEFKWQEYDFRLSGLDRDIHSIIYRPKGYEKNSDLIIYLHGIGRDQKEWVMKGWLGEEYARLLNNNPSLKKIPVVSISFGAGFLFIDKLSAPFNIDLNNFFVEKVIPHLIKKLNRKPDKTNIFLIGHSMGGYNALLLAFQYPKIFKNIAVISPFIPVVSPFDEDAWDKQGDKVGMTSLQKFVIGTTLKRAFNTEKKWNNYKLETMLKRLKEPKPYIYISVTENDIPGFKSAIVNFSKTLTKYNVNNSFSIDLAGSHNTQCNNYCELFLTSFINKINQ